MSVRFITIVLAGVSCFALFSTRALGPNGGTPTATQVEINSAADTAMRMREWQLTHISDEVNDHFKKQMVALFPQIREDFTHMQIVNNEMMQAVFVKKSMNYK